MLRDDGVEILRGTASIGPDFEDTAPTRRLADPVILADVKVGMAVPRTPVRMDADRRMGALYPFSSAQKLAKITESSLYYTASSPLGRAIVPLEMISVLMQYTSDNGAFGVRGPAS